MTTGKQSPRNETAKRPDRKQRREPRDAERRAQWREAEVGRNHDGIDRTGSGADGTDGMQREKRKQAHEHFASGKPWADDSRWHRLLDAEPARAGVTARFPNPSR